MVRSNLWLSHVHRDLQEDCMLAATTCGNLFACHSFMLAYGTDTQTHTSTRAYTPAIKHLVYSASVVLAYRSFSSSPCTANMDATRLPSPHRADQGPHQFFASLELFF